VEIEPTPEPAGRGLRGAGGSIFASGAGFDAMSIAGPFNGSKTGDTPVRKKILTCKPATPQQEEPCARQILGKLTRRAYRGFSTPTDVEELMAIYRQGRNARDFDTGVQRALE